MSYGRRRFDKELRTKFTTSYILIILDRPIKEYKESEIKQFLIDMSRGLTKEQQKKFKFVDKKEKEYTFDDLLKMYQLTG